MRSRWMIWLLGITTVLVIVLGWRWLPLEQSSAQPSLPAVIENPPIVAERLLADVEALAFPRFTEGDRAQARTYIQQQLEAAEWQVEERPFATGVNLVAERLGTNPEAGALLLGAHYDTVERSPGADDNASAVAVLLETARLLGPQPTPRTLRLALFDQEEIDLSGSQAIAIEQAERGDLQGALILEMLGYACYTDGCQTYPPLPVTPTTTKGNFLAVIGDQNHQPLVDAFQPTDPELPPIASLTVPTLGRLTPDLLRSDHVPFWRRSIGAVMVTDTANFRNPHYHQPTDLPTNLDQPFFTGAAQHVVNAVNGLLSGDRALRTAA
jgi:Zn-dependent M28 family amino/carboxypeptidase